MATKKDLNTIDYKYYINEFNKKFYIVLYKIKSFLKDDKLFILVSFTEQFSSMIKAHVPLAQILKNLRDDTSEKVFQEVLNDVIKDIETGIELDKAIAKHPKIFEKIYISMVRAGMKSGKLDMTLKELSAYLNQYYINKRKVLSALSYPIFMVFAAIVLFLVMILQIIPTFEKIFNEAEKELPALTQSIISISQFTREYWGLIITIVVILFFLILNLTQTEKGKEIIDAIKLKLWFFGEINKKVAIAKFIRTFGVLLQAKVSVLEAIDIAKDSTQNVVIENEIELCRKKIENGEFVSDAFDKMNKLPSLVKQMIQSGEEGGNTDELLIVTATYYDEQVNNKINTMVSLINPTLTFVIGLVIATLLMAIFQPIFNMADIHR